MPDVNDFNTKIIEEFRANGGKVGGPFEGATVLLLHHKGAKTGTERVNPVAYRPVGDSWAVFASKAGAPTNPDWYHNLRAHPETTVEVGTETIPVVAHVADDAERAPSGRPRSATTRVSPTTRRRRRARSRRHPRRAS